MVFARDGRTLYFRTGQGLFAAPINPAANANAGGARGGGGRRPRRARRRARRQRRRRPEPAATNATARHVTYTVNLEVDHKALRAQVFNEGWRIMKNRFYDAKMHGADWNAAKTMYEPLLNYLVDEDELHTVMMMMIGQLNASHTGVSGGPNPVRVGGPDALSGLRRRDGRVRLLQGRPHLQERPGRSRLPEDQDRQLPRSRSTTTI